MKQSRLPWSGAQICSPEQGFCVCSTPLTFRHEARLEGAIVRALRSHTRHLASLARVLQHVGRRAKTIHLLDYCNDQPFRRRILTQPTAARAATPSLATSATATARRTPPRYRQGQEEQLVRFA
jgi:hypothetical protein